MSTLEQLKEKNQALEQRVEKLEQRFENPPVSRRAAIAGGAGILGLSALSGSASAGTNQVGTIGTNSDPVDIEAEDIVARQVGDSNNRPDIFADEVNVNSLTGQVGDSNNRPDIFADEVNVNSLTGVNTGPDLQGCRVFLSSTQSISSNNRTKIRFDRQVYDSNGNFDTTNHEWTCPQDGIYAVNLQVKFTGGQFGEPREALIGSGSNAIINRNGASNRMYNSAFGDSLNVSTIGEYQSSDTVAGYAFNEFSSDNVESLDGSDDTFLEVVFLGGL